MEGTRAKECLEQRAQSGCNCVRAGEGCPGSCGTTAKGWLLCSGVPGAAGHLGPQSESPCVVPCWGKSQRAPLWFVGCWTPSPCGALATLPLVGTSLGMLSPMPGPNHLPAPPPSSPHPCPVSAPARSPGHGPSPRHGCAAIAQPSSAPGRNKMVRGDYSKGGSSCRALTLQHPRKHRELSWGTGGLNRGEEVTPGMLVPLFLSPLTVPVAPTRPPG